MLQKALFDCPASVLYYENEQTNSSSREGLTGTKPGKLWQTPLIKRKTSGEFRRILNLSVTQTIPLPGINPNLKLPGDSCHEPLRSAHLFRLAYAATLELARER